MPSLRHLQEHQPWTIPYSDEFAQSRVRNPVRQISHDLLRVVKAVGRMADQCEKADHEFAASERSIFVANLPDLVICAMHIATEIGLDLESEVIWTMKRHNGVEIPPEE
jgi:hypothetical protein